MATNLGSFFSSALSSIPIVGPFLGEFGGLMVAGLVKLGGKDLGRDQKFVRWSVRA